MLAQNSPQEASTVLHQELPDVQAGFRKDRGTRGQIANICWIIVKAREFQKNIYFCIIDSVDHNKLWKILKKMEIPDHLTCLLRNLYARQEATVRTRHGTTDCLRIGKGVHQSCIFPSLEDGNTIFPHSSVGKESACNVGDLGSIPGWGRSPGEGKGYPLQ